jgi:hypothetical protein
MRAESQQRIVMPLKIQAPIFAKVFGFVMSTSRIITPFPQPWTLRYDVDLLFKEDRTMTPTHDFYLTRHSTLEPFTRCCAIVPCIISSFALCILIPHRIFMSRSVAVAISIRLRDKKARDAIIDTTENKRGLASRHP